jgi:hypothetical protein
MLEACARYRATSSQHLPTTKCVEGRGTTEVLVLSEPGLVAKLGAEAIDRLAVEENFNLYKAIPRRYEFVRGAGKGKHVTRAALVM